MIVRIPSPLLSYTDQRPEVRAEGTTLDEVLADLDRRHPGLRFRVVDEHGRLRAHVRLYVNETPSDDLSTAVGPQDVVHLVAALSGG